MRKGYFQAWVPEPVQTLLLFILVIPVLLNSGTYTGIAADMVGGLGTMSEYITMANYMVTIGMISMYPFLLPIKGVLKTKHILLITIGVSALLNYICATTAHPEVIVICCFLLGLVKMVSMIELIIPLMGILSPTGDRARFYAFFYPISISVGQVSGWLTAYLTYEYNWQYVYYFMLLLQLGSLVIVLLLMHDEPTFPVSPLPRLDMVSWLLISLTLALITYVGVFGKVESWFDSLSIQLASLAAVISGLLFILRQLNSNRPYLDLSILTYKSVWSASLLILLLGVFFGSSSLQTTLTGLQRFSALVNMQIQLWMIPGIALGAVSCFFWFSYHKTYKRIVFIGFAAFVLHHLMLYFLVDSQVTEQALWIPTLLKGYGMTVLFIALGLYMLTSVNHMGMAGLLSSGMITYVFRSLLGPLVFSTLYVNLLYAGQVEHLLDMAQQMDGLQPGVQARFQGAYAGAIAQGGSSQIAQSVAAQSLLSTVQVQTTLVTLKQIYGWITLAGLAVLVFVALFHFQPFNRRKLVNWRRRARGLEIIPIS
ncbi:hypothetical protein [Spirosoma litoris]